MRTFFASVLGVLVSLSTAAAEVRVHFFDVGEGDSTAIEFESGKTVLIDAGNVRTGPRLVREAGLNSIDTLILTHPHPDHISGVFAVLDAFSPRVIFDNGEPLTAHSAAQDLYRWYEEEVRVKRGAKVLAAGHRWREGEAELEVLWPKAGELTDDWNTNSIVLLLRVRSFSLLLMADANHRTERALGTLSPVTVLRVGHHGAADATSPQFLEAISPKVAIISVNKDNVRGYPDPKVVERLRAGGRTVFRTDEDGTVVLTIERDGSYRVQTDDHGNQRQTGASSRSQQLSTTPERPRKEGEHDGH